MQNELYKLLVFLVNDDGVFLIDTAYADELEELEYLGRLRMANNSCYKCVVMGYKLETAKMIEDTIFKAAADALVTGSN